MMNIEEKEELIPVCWSDLPFDLVDQIADKVMSFSLSDYIRFGAVCYPWRCFLLEDYEHIKLPNKLPVLLLPSHNNHNNNYHQKEAAAAAEAERKKKEDGYNKQQQEEEEEVFYDMHDYYNPREIWLGLNHKQRHQNTRSFYSILERKVYDFQLPIPSYLNCRGSSHGWLVVVEESFDGTYPVHLLNPFRPDNHNKIHLPPLTSSDPDDEPVIHSYFLHKAVLSARPSSSSSSSLILSTTTTDDELVVLGLCGTGQLKFCRPGDKEWTPLIYKGLLDSAILNLTCYRGQFWMILQNGRAVAFDIYPLLPKLNLTTIIDPPDDHQWPDIRYLVESAGNFFQVRRDVYMSDDVSSDYSYSTVGFSVFKLDWASMKWVKTNSLEGHMFFLGDNKSISLFASDYYFSGGGGGVGSCKPNSIYFTDDYWVGYGSKTGRDGPHDMGVFNLDDGSFERFEPYYTVDSRHIMPAPIWIQPMP